MVYPNPGDKIRWINVPLNCKNRGDEFGVYKYRDGDYLYCMMNGTRSIVELYPGEIEILEKT